MYQFTERELIIVLHHAILLYREYIDRHGQSEENAATSAVSDVLDGMSEERQLIRHGELSPDEASHEYSDKLRQLAK